MGKKERDVMMQLLAAERDEAMKLYGETYHARNRIMAERDETEAVLQASLRLQAQYEAERDEALAQVKTLSDNLTIESEHCHTYKARAEKAETATYRFMDDQIENLEAQLAEALARAERAEAMNEKARQRAAVEMARAEKAEALNRETTKGLQGLKLVQVEAQLAEAEKVIEFLETETQTMVGRNVLAAYRAKHPKEKA